MKQSPMLSLALLAAVGCGKSDAGNGKSDAGNGKSTADEFADSYCAEVAKCCGQADMPADGKMCHQWMSFAAAGGTFNSKEGDACLAEMRAQVADGTFCSSLSDSSACNAVYGSDSGNKQPGQTCEFNDDCAPSSDGKVVCASLYVDGQSIDKCQVQQKGKAGDAPCVGTQDGIMFVYASGATDVIPKGYVCNTADGLRCGSDGACVAMPTVGEACDLGNDCVHSAYCDHATDKCVARVAAGGACTGTDSDECADDTYCPSSGTKQCTAKLDKGAACASHSMCRSGSCSNGVCDKGSSLDDLGLSLLCGS